MATIKSQMALNDGMSIVLKHIIKNMQTLNGSFIAMQQSCDEAVHIKNFEAASASLSEQIALAERLTNGYGEATEMEERLNQNIQTGTAAANGMLSSVKKLVSAFGIATGVKKAIDLSDQMSSTRARLSLIADDSQAASVADGIIGRQRLCQIRRLRLSQFLFCFCQPCHQPAGFLPDTAEHTVGGFDPTVEFAFVGADTPCLHLPDSGSLVNGG